MIMYEDSNVLHCCFLISGFVFYFFIFLDVIEEEADVLTLTRTF